MKDYLEGYLDVIPQSDRTRVQDVLKKNKEILGTSISENEFVQIINKILEDHKKLTENVPQGARLNSRAYNQFFGNVQVDLDVMFAESDLVERALGSYERLYDGIIGDLAKEIKSLQERVGTLRLVAQGEDGLIVKSVDFSNTTEMETDRAKYAHLFRDRDGSEVGSVNIQRNDDDSYLCLGRATSIDRIRDDTGKTIAQLEIKDQRGVPIAQNKYPIANAIDASRDSYWGEVILTDEPIATAMDSFEAGGAMTKFTITFPRQEVVSEISLSPFTAYPLEIVSIRYEEDVETYHVPKELIATKTESTGTMTIQFPSIIARRFTFVLRQKNHTKNVYMIREKELAKADLWEQISQRETEVTLDSPPSLVAGLANSNVTVDQSTLDTYSGWDIYLGELTKHNEDYAKYMTELEAYHTAHAKYVQDINNYNSTYGQNVSAVARAEG